MQGIDVFIFSPPNRISLIDKNDEGVQDSSYNLTVPKSFEISSYSNEKRIFFRLF